LDKRIKDWWTKQDQLNIFISILIFLVSFLTYLRTMAPTVSFWDCGEFIACSYILGIPHPPGTPLFVLIGRLSTLIPWFKEIAARMNFLSVLGSSFTIALTYLLIVKLFNRWTKEEGYWWRVAKYVGGVVGSLFMGFGLTYWSNSVETEVYSLAMFLMVLLVYLTILWSEKKGTPKGDRILVLISYLALLSIGVHMTSFLVMPAIFLFVILEDKSKLKDFRFWMAGLVLGLVMMALVPFLVMMGLWLVLSLIMFSVRLDYRWYLSLALVLVGLIGFSVHAYIPVRSSLDPAIDENDPDDWASIKYFLERKQYGQQSMISRMFYRRGSWEHQFGVYPNMGFWGFFREQYMDKSLWFLPLLLGAFGIYSQFSKRRKDGAFFLILLLLSTVGLTLYMNFADGTRYDPQTGELIRLEVRERDYFWTPGFMFFAMLMGLGVGGLIGKFGEFLDKIKSPKLIFKACGYVLVLVLLFLPSLAFDQGFNSPNNRRGNFIPYDYSYNLLMSCDKDGIMFTNGDNDTFPLWFLQEVEKIRKDVRIINLSLLNTDWYILQLKNHMKVPIDLSDEEIKWTKVRLDDGREVDRPAKPFYDQLLGKERYLVPYYDNQKKRVVGLQDQMIRIILLSNQWRYPVYFSTTVSPEFRLGLEDHLIGEGFAYLIVPEKTQMTVNKELTHQKYWEVYRYRGVGDINVRKDENTVGILFMYPEKFIELASYYFKENQPEKGITEIKKGIEIYPDYYRPYLILAQMYRSQGNPEEEKKILNQGVSRVEKLVRKYPKIVSYRQYLGILYNQTGRNAEAERALWSAYQDDPTNSLSYQGLVGLYISTQQYPKAINLLEKWIRTNPSDQVALRTLEQLRSMK